MFFDDLSNEMGDLYSGNFRFREGDTVDDYIIEHVFTGSGMGLVYLASAPKLERKVVLKFLAPWLSNNEVAKERLIAEAKAVAKLEHPNVCHILDIKECKGMPFLVMAYVPGRTLKEILASNPIPIHKALEYTRQTCQGLASAHAKGIVHRDIKPGNLMVVENEEGTNTDRVVIIDFGIAKTPALDITMPGDILGSVYTMSPEQASGHDVDARSDVWSVGVVLYQMLTGEQPFTGKDHEQVRIRVKELQPMRPSMLNAEVSRELDTLVSLCLTKDPDKRFQTADALRDAIATVQAGERIKHSSRRAAKRQMRTRPLSRKKSSFPNKSVLVALLAIATAVPVLLFGLPRTTPDTIAVLPIEVVGHPNNDATYFEGIHHAVTSALATKEPFAGRYSVLPASEVDHETGALSATELHAQYNVDWVIQVRLAYHDSRVALYVELVEVKKGMPNIVNSNADDTSALEFGNPQYQILESIATVIDISLEDSYLLDWQETGTTMPVASTAYYTAIGKLQDRDVEANVLEAIELLKRAIELDPSFEEAHALLGKAYAVRFNRTDNTALIRKALFHTTRALELEPELAEGYLARGMVYMASDSFDQAVAAFEETLRHEPLHHDARIQLGIAHVSLKNLPEAEEAFLMAVRGNDGYWRTHNALGWFYSKTGQHARAIEAYQGVVRNRPLNPEGFNNIGAQLERMGRYEEALDYFQNAISLNPEGAIRETTRAYRNRTGLYYRQKNYEAAVEGFKATLQKDPRSIDGWISLGNSYWGLDRMQEASDAWNTAVLRSQEYLVKHPKNEHTMALMIQGLVQLKQYDQARKALATLDSLNPQNGDVLYRMAIASWYLGNKEAAKTYAHRAAQNGLSLGTVEYLSPWAAGTTMTELEREVIALLSVSS